MFRSYRGFRLTTQCAHGSSHLDIGPKRRLCAFIGWKAREVSPYHSWVVLLGFRGRFSALSANVDWVFLSWMMNARARMRMRRQALGRGQGLWYAQRVENSGRCTVPPVCFSFLPALLSLSFFHLSPWAYYQIRRPLHDTRRIELCHCHFRTRRSEVPDVWQS